jgi:serine/threonine-protein kinase
VDPAVFPNPLLLQRAERELKQLERVDLPEVARVLAHGRQADQLWIAMELVSGVDLGRLVAQRGAMPAMAACHLVRQTARGLAEAAKQGVIHRDLAAKNVLIGDGDAVKIINFPIAVPFSDRVQGVPEFLSPEQVEGKPADQRSSIYSLGALLYYSVTGRPPFSGTPSDVHRAHISHEPPRPSQLAHVPEAIEGLIVKALEKTSAKRFMTLHQMIGELDSILAGAVAAASAVAAQGKTKFPVGPAQTLVGVAAFHQQPGGGPAMLDPSMARPVATSGELVGGRAVEARRESARLSAPLASIPQQEMAVRPAAVIVPTPPASPAIPPAGGATSTGRGKPKVTTQPPPTDDSAGKFRETMWFKKGELDEAAAVAAASARDGELVHDKADALPIEDRYLDDGTLDRRDAERLSLRTGGTDSMPAHRAEPLTRRRVSERELLGELRRGRIWLYVFLLGLLAGIGAAVYYLAT